MSPKATPRNVIGSFAQAEFGKESARHKEMAKGLDIQFFFARPYHSWERGANENTNGLARQYTPKGTDFEDLTIGIYQNTGYSVPPAGLFGTKRVKFIITYQERPFSVPRPERTCQEDHAIPVIESD